MKCFYKNKLHFKKVLSKLILFSLKRDSRIANVRSVNYSLASQTTKESNVVELNNKIFHPKFLASKLEAQVKSRVTNLLSNSKSCNILLRRRGLFSPSRGLSRRLWGGCYA
jgi:hypothetical protein